MTETISESPAPAPDPAPQAPGEPLLDVRGLVKYFPVKGGGLVRRKMLNVRAVDGIDLSVAPGESVGLVGESGCGKSTTGRLISRLLEPTGGSIRYDGTDITHATRKQIAPIRSQIQMIFQDPYSSLNPRQTVGAIVSSPMEVNGIDPEGGRKKRVQELLERVGLNPEHYNRFPHEFSGGQRQRIGIARALALQPRLIVADEPVSALDVSIQAQVVNLLQGLQRDMGIAFVFIAHDLAVVRHFSQRVAVMYLGKIVEIADRTSLYSNPHHPYTHTLLAAVPEADPDKSANRTRVHAFGDMPSPINPPSGCRFRTRCPKAQDVCANEEPPLIGIETLLEGHRVACHFPGPLEATAKAEETMPEERIEAALEAGISSDPE
ncbi:MULTISPECIES: oligopeptide/dipeptide ABC transporter ATP-binding protein [unclassified Embleya]|uniref:ABC transporter ATP-binding protein n=1 Tax=unclassified Embleya TaxID=2699296 RepID=UPI0033E5F609